jgi:hypothetical protein
MGRTACADPQCLYKGALYLFYLAERSFEIQRHNLIAYIYGYSLQRQSFHWSLQLQNTALQVQPDMNAVNLESSEKIIIIIIIRGISFMQDIYTYIPETNHVPREH